MRKRPGAQLTAADVNRVEQDLGDVLRLGGTVLGLGGGPICAQHRGGSVSLSVMEATVANVAVIGAITAFGGAVGPPSTWTYTADAMDGSGRQITDLTAPENKRDANVAYHSAGYGDPCIMWWETDGTPHLVVFDEIYYTALLPT